MKEREKLEQQVSETERLRLENKRLKENLSLCLIRISEAEMTAVIYHDLCKKLQEKLMKVHH